MNTLIIYAMIFGGILKDRVKEAANNLFKDENGAVDLIAIVVLIGIVVVLAIIFRDAIKSLITDLLNKIRNNAVDATN